MARYGEAFKNRTVARLLPPESANVGAVAREIGVSVQTLERWREDAQSRPARGRAWTAGARLDAVITAAALDEAGKSAWCREHGVYPAELDKWRLSATSAPSEPEEARASPQATRQDKKRIKELERELLRKDRALAETAALLVLSKKVAAIFNVSDQPFHATGCAIYDDAAFSGNSSSIRLFGQAGNFSSVSFSQACGSKPLSLAVPSRL